jgi:hypothetical protein
VSKIVSDLDADSESSVDSEVNLDNTMSVEDNSLADSDRSLILKKSSRTNH